MKCVVREKVTFNITGAIRLRVVLLFLDRVSCLSSRRVEVRGLIRSPVARFGRNGHTASHVRGAWNGGVGSRRRFLLTRRITTLLDKTDLSLLRVIGKI